MESAYIRNENTLSRLQSLSPAAPPAMHAPAPASICTTVPGACRAASPFSGPVAGAAASSCCGCCGAAAPGTPHLWLPPYSICWPEGDGRSCWGCASCCCQGLGCGISCSSDA
jgi:hypothetical protein